MPNTAEVARQRKLRRIQEGLRACARDIQKGKDATEESKRLYAEGQQLGVTLVQLAEWRDSTPEAVGRALWKLRNGNATKARR